MIYEKDMRVLTGIVGALIFLISCGPSQKSIFSKKSPHEKYSDALNGVGLDKTQLGLLWVSAATKSLTQPLVVSLPYKETGYFPAEEPRAAGYIFNAKRGEKLIVTINKTPLNESILFTELWKPAEERKKLQLLAIADTNTNVLDHEVNSDGRYLLRIQPELLRSVEYTLTITTAPSLAFPVRESDKSNVISLWGTARDAGGRKHEGIDIGAKFRTPVVAVADGYVTSVSENNLGGKIIFLRPSGKDYNLYYAHLDSQIVLQGQDVKTGEILGLIGNTGNAKSTVPHLHFGVYTSSGAIDPFPFINNKRPLPRPVTASPKEINGYMSTRAPSIIYDIPAATGRVLLRTGKGNAMRILAATDNWYKVLLPDNQEGFIQATSLTSSIVQKLTLTETKKILDHPHPGAASKNTVAAGTVLNVAGIFNDYYLVSQKDYYGWVEK
jgi:murein DD-endopeptidase MepM/ murein hydrolase activator NlpD